MSRRPPGVGLFIALLLGAGVASPALTRAASAYGERVYETNPVTGRGDPVFTVYRDQMIAHSFSPAKSLTLLNLTLRLLNRGSQTNVLTVSIRPDDPVAHVPSSTILAEQSIVSPTGSVTLQNVPFPFPLDLSAGQAYRIVATNSAGNPANGYEWYDSGGDTYTRGYAAVYNTTDSVWTILPVDMHFVSYRRDLETNVNVALVADRMRASPNDIVTFTIYFNNSATQNAPTVWINETLPDGFTFVSDTAGSAAIPSTTPFPSYTFSDVPNGVHSFSITTQVDICAVPGTVLTSTVSSAYSNLTGGIHSGSAAQASVVIGEQAKELYLAPNASPPLRLTTSRPSITATYSPTIGRGNEASFVLSPSFARPFRVLEAGAWFFVDSQSHKVQTLQIELSLMDAGGTVVAFSQKSVTMDNKAIYELFSFPFPGADATFPYGHSIQLRVRNSSNSTDGLFLGYNSTLAPSRLDLTTTTYVSIDALEIRDAFGSAKDWTSLDPLVIRGNVSDPFGSSSIADARVNITSLSGISAAAWTSMRILRTDLSNPSGWKLFE